MMPVKLFICNCLILILFLAPEITISAQVTQIQVRIDTSDYLTYNYEGALDNNLMIAASRNYTTEIERLIKNGANVDAQTTEGATPLIFATANNQLSSVLTLLKYNPSLDQRTIDYETALSISVKNQNLEITEALLRAGADINQADDSGATPLHYAAVYGAFYLADLLLYYDADYDRKANDGTTPLMAAIWAGFADIADLLIQNGANMEARDKEGFTPFLIAAQNGDTLLMNILLKKGVDLYEKNIHNYDALSLAIGSNHEQAVNLLLSKGKEWVSAEKKGTDPYMVASAYGRKNMINSLKSNNIPGRIGLKIDELAISASAKFTSRDFYSGMSLSLKAPLVGAGIIAGVDSKLWDTRVLVKESNINFTQYLDKSSVIYAGFFRDFVLSESLSGRNLFLSTSLAAGYAFGNKFKGTGISPESRLVLLPAVNIKLVKKHFILTGGLEYYRSGFYQIGPVWFRAGFSYNFYLSRVRAPGKIIKWY